MADLRVENPAITERFVQLLAEQGVRLPLALSREDVGVVADADGRGIITIDVNRELPDDQVHRIAAWIMLAVNTCGLAVSAGAVEVSMMELGRIIRARRNAPRRCDTNHVGAAGECLACDADQGERCREPRR